MKNVCDTNVGKLKYIPRRKKNTVNNIVFIVIMLLVPVAHWLIFYLGVNVNSILLAFKLPTGKWSPESLKHACKAIIKGGTQLSVAIKNTSVYFAKDIVMLFFNLIVAYFLYKKMLCYKVFRIIFYLPCIVSGVAISTMFANFIAPSGPVGVILSKLGVKPVPEFLANSRYATNTILLYTIWLGWGGNMLILGGCLERVPLELLESARIDGIGAFREFFIIIIPLVWTTLSTLLILTLTGIFSAGGPILLFTKGLYNTTTIGYWIFDKVKYKGESAYNEVAATGLIFTLVGVPAIMFAKWLIEKIPTVEY